MIVGGGTKTEHFDSLEEAKESFQQLFFEKSQNYWGHEFLKVPGGLDLVELEVDESKIEEVHKLDPTSSTSSLPIQLREIISLFFDVHLMAKQMAEFEVSFFLYKIDKYIRIEYSKFSWTLKNSLWLNWQRLKF